MFVKPKRPVSRVFLHCSASDNPAHDDVSVIDSWHKANGWSQVGYHYFIKKNGELQNGRPLELVPAAQAGHNVGTIAICLHGLLGNKFTDAQFDTLRRLARDINFAYGGKVTFHGHCEVSAKSCPVFNYRMALNLDSKGRLGAGSPDEDEADADQQPHATRVLRRGDRGDEVAALQRLLNFFTTAWGVMLVLDGDFGKQTEAAVKRFQETRHLVPDGIVGPLTREALRG